jgi:hypothetical protein
MVAASGQPADYVWAQGTLGQDPGFQCAGFDPKLCTSVAKKDSAARSMQLGRLQNRGIACWPLRDRAHTTGMLAADYGKVLCVLGLMAALQRQKMCNCAQQTSAAPLHHGMQGVEQGSSPCRDAQSLCCPAGSRRSCVQIRPPGATPVEACPPPRRTKPVLWVSRLKEHGKPKTSKLRERYGLNTSHVTGAWYALPYLI